MLDWIRTIAIGGAIAAQGCVLEEGEVDEGEVDEGDGESTGGSDDDGDDAPADDSASYTSAAEAGDSDDGGEPPPERIPAECSALDASCDASRAREVECGWDDDDDDDDFYSCEGVLGLFPQTPECCTALAEFIACSVALPCDDDDIDSCLLAPARECNE